MERLRKLSKGGLALAAALTGAAFGIMLFVTYRMAVVRSENIHNHANFALYVNGVRDEFKSFTFFEEVQACVASSAENPKARVHMHNQDPDLVHVHDGGVTWGHFFANLGYGLTDESLQTDEGVFYEADGKRLRFILNGEEVQTAANRIIGSEDVLLIDFGDSSDEQLQERYKAIPGDAHESNGKYDPGNCSGDEAMTLGKRFREALGLREAGYDSRSH